MKHKTLKGSFYGYFWNVITEQYADFEGRSSREDYWMFLLWYLIIIISTSILSFGILGALGVVVFLVPGLAIQVRRFHDIDMSGWWLLGFNISGFIPIVNFIAAIIWIYLYCLKGDLSSNQYGEPVS